MARTDRQQGRGVSPLRLVAILLFLVVLTGGMAYLFARLGAQVVVCGRRIEKLQSTADGIKQRIGGEVGTHAMTIRDAAAVDTMMAEIFDTYGRLDLVVNNGGGQFPQAAIDYTVKGWNAVIDTNLNGTWYMMQSAARQWQARGQAGNIVNIVAVVARGMPQVAHTCAARAGVIYLSKSLSTEWAPLKIRVNCVAPGSIATEGLNVYPRAAAEAFRQCRGISGIARNWQIYHRRVAVCRWRPAAVGRRLAGGHSGLLQGAFPLIEALGLTVC